MHTTVTHIGTAIQCSLVFTRWIKFFLCTA